MQAGHTREPQRPTTQNLMASLTGMGQKSNLELRNDSPFPEGPLQLRTRKNEGTPGTIWTGDVPEAGLEEPRVTEEQHVATALAHKLCLGK